MCWTHSSKCSWVIQRSLNLSSYDPGMDAYERQHQERVVRNLKKKALTLGFDLVAKPPAPECVS